MVALYVRSIGVCPNHNSKIAGEWAGRGGSGTQTKRVTARPMLWHPVGEAYDILVADLSRPALAWPS
jgi:hypothetical protein